MSTVSQFLERTEKSKFVAATLSPTEIVIEASSPRCENPCFPPLKEFLRGRWDLHRFPAVDMHEAVSRMPGPIPGIRIGVDPANRTVRRYDPVELEEFAELWARKLEHNELYKEFLSAEARGKPWPETIQRDCSDTTIKTWLYWSRQLVGSDDKNPISAVHIRKSARLPTLEEIALMPGKTQVGQFNDYISYPLFLEDKSQYGDFRPGGVPAQVPAGAGQLAGTMDLASMLAMLQQAGFKILAPGQSEGPPVQQQPSAAQQQQQQQSHNPPDQPNSGNKPRNGGK